MTAIALQLPRMEGHPNRVPFEGVLTLVDVPSDKAPSGSKGHRVILTRKAALEALPSLMGMAVDFKAGWDGHDARQKCGIITAARLRGDALHVSGFLFGRDYAEMMRELQEHPADALGMSYELADAHVENMRRDVWKLTKATFTGAAILLRSKAAYRATSFRVAPRRKRCRPMGPSLNAAGTTIRKDDTLQCLECVGCGAVVELSRAIAGDPEKVYLLQEQMAQDHRNCGDYGADQAAARRSAKFDRQVRMAMEKLQQRNER